MDRRPVGETVVAVGEGDTGRRRSAVHGGRLLAFVALRFLDVGEVGVELPCDLECQRTPGAVADRRADLQLIERELISRANVDRPLRNAVSIDGLLVARLPAAATSVLGDLGIDVRKLERVGRYGSRLA